MVGNGVSRLSLDETDLRIIGLLQEDGRRSNSGISRVLGLSESTVRRRIERLLRDDAIKIVAIASNERLGLPVHVIMGVSLDLARNATAARALMNLVQVGWLAATTGAYDMLLEAYFPSMRHLHEFITDELAQVEGVERVETAIVLELAKHTYDWQALIRPDHGTIDAFRISDGPCAQDEATVAQSAPRTR